jgi:chemotaxis signal transduction protein
MREATELRSSRQRTEEVWLARAKRLSQRARLDRAGQDALPVVVLGIGKERYGIDLPDVAEVFPPLRPTRVPGTAAMFAGVINVHGEIRPVIDLRRLLGIDPVTETVRKAGLARVILLRRNGREMGLQIDTVEQIRWVGSEESSSGDQASAASPQVSTYIKGSTKDLLMMLSTEALFAELDAADQYKGVTN